VEIKKNTPVLPLPKERVGRAIFFYFGVPLLAGDLPEMQGEITVGVKSKRNSRKLGQKKKDRNYRALPSLAYFLTLG